MMSNAERPAPPESAADAPRTGSGLSDDSPDSSTKNGRAGQATQAWRSTNTKVRDTASKAIAVASPPVKNAIGTVATTAQPAIARVRVYRVHITIGLSAALSALLVVILARRIRSS
jgi:hypothetical protein